MSIENKLSPPLDEGEQELIGFDFGPILAEGEYIGTVVSISCTVCSGNHHPDEARKCLSGQFRIVPSQRTGAEKGMVAMMFGSVKKGASYRLQCVVTTNKYNQRKSIITHI